MTKKLFLALLLLLISYSSYCKVILSGQIKNAPASNEVTLNCYTNNRDYKKIASKKIQLDKQGRFTTSLKISGTSYTQLITGDEYINLFLTANDSLYMTVDYKNFNESIFFVGRGAANNNFMAAYQLSDNNIYNGRYSTYKDAEQYLLFEDSIEKHYTNPANAKQTGIYSEAFVTFINSSPKQIYTYPFWMNIVIYDSINNRYTYKPESGHYTNFLKIFNFQKKDNDKVRYKKSLISLLARLNDRKTEFQLPDSMNLLEEEKTVILKNYNHRKQLYQDSVLDFQLTEFLRYNISHVKDDPKFAEELVKDYKSICKNKKYDALIDKIYLQTSKLAMGNPAPDFTLVNVQGQNVTLSSLKGKVVYIDFWATWCGPCVEAMESSHKLSDKFKNREDIVFLYVNVSDEYKYWKKYIAKEKMKGINLFADRNQSHELMDLYLFTGIPHYVLIDKKGNLLNTNAAPPSGMEYEILEALK